MRQEITHELRADFSKARPDGSVDFNWHSFTRAEHDMWKFLFNRQVKLLEHRACKEYLDGIKKLEMDDTGIPNYDAMSEKLFKASGFRLITVAGYLPSEIFLAHLANRQFPITTFIRTPEQIDYLKEPDIFHDMFGHVPMLAHPLFADYMEAFGKGGVKAHHMGYTALIDTLYWFTVEFGLIKAKEGMRIYGSGILSSKGESIYCLESPVPNRLGLDIKRAMRTQYRIDEFQKTYFVIESFEDLMKSTEPDFTPIYKEVTAADPIPIGQVLPTDKVYHKGSVAA